MGRKKKTYNITKELISFTIAIIIFALMIQFSNTTIYSNIENKVANSNIAKEISEKKETNLNTLVNTEVSVNKEIIQSVSDTIKIEEGKLNILFLNVGQADSELIILNGKTILIDAGNSSDGEKIVSGIKALGIEKLDYVFGTHVHEDHMGGMSYIVDSFDIGEFYMPYDTSSTTKYYKRLLESLTNKNVSVNEAHIGDVIDFSDAKVEIMSVNNDEPDNINLQSIVLQLNYGNMKYLFMGDAEEENEKARTWEDIDLIKVGHHGSNTSSSEKFLNQVLPEIGIIEVGKDNSYGLPKENIINRYEKIGTKLYRTDENGTIQVISDGTTNKIIEINLSFDSKQ